MSRVVLLKFGSKNHMDAFYEKGEIYLNTFSYFKELEYSSDGRADKHEYIEKHFSGSGLDKMNFKIQFEEQSFDLSRQGGLLSFTMECSKTEFSHLYCMSYLDLDSSEKHNKSINENNFAQNKDYVVLIHNFDNFIEMLKNVFISQKWSTKCDIIKYIDKDDYCGEMGCFKKFNEYSYQNEWRIAIKCKEIEEPQTICIGSLANIALPPMTKEEFYSLSFKGNVND